MNKSIILNVCGSKIFEDFHKSLESEYIVTMKFIEYHVNQSSIYVNGNRLCWRDSKKSPVKYAPDVIEIVQGTPLRYGGSINYPEPSFKEGFVILKFKCKGFPINCSWKLIAPELLALERVDD